ncbi:hypothetical protein ACFY0F_23830 [Streptomyces sp. NPDC001544]|uniref:hypothetical protein n=1 Tax=Streptomyces sp. NPDC001544 TaxID=3364584 RepID=UPI0036B8E61E
MVSSKNPGSRARNELAAALRLKGLNEREIDTLINAALAEELRASADEIAEPVPPLQAGPRTEFERGLVTAFHALRARADKLDGGAR